MPLSVGWLRFRLRSMIEAGKPLAESNGRYVPVETDRIVTPESPVVEEEVRSPPPSLGDTVMWEVRKVLLEHGPMKPAQIRQYLSPRIQESARKHWKHGLKRLAKDMSERAGRGYYFRSAGGGRYAALEGDTAVSNDSERST